MFIFSASFILSPSSPYIWITKRFILLQSLHMNPVITALSVLPISVRPVARTVATPWLSAHVLARTTPLPRCRSTAVDSATPRDRSYSERKRVGRIYAFLPGDLLEFVYCRLRRSPARSVRCLSSRVVRAVHRGPGPPPFIPAHPLTIFHPVEYYSRIPYLLSIQEEREHL